MDGLKVRLKGRRGDEHLPDIFFQFGQQLLLVYLATIQMELVALLIQFQLFPDIEEVVEENIKPSLTIYEVYNECPEVDLDLLQRNTSKFKSYFRKKTL